jgi:hypothetical protein
VEYKFTDWIASVRIQWNTPYEFPSRFTRSTRI